MKKYISTDNEVLIIHEDGRREHLADTWDREVAALIAQLLNEHEAKQWH